MSKPFAILRSKMSVKARKTACKKAKAILQELAKRIKKQ